MVNDITFDEWRELSYITFEWADSYDSKQFDRLAAVLAPQVTLDYSEAMGTKFEKIPAKVFVRMSDDKNRMGGLVDSIHLVGASKFERTGPDSVTGHHQVRTEYKRYTSMKKDEVEATGNGLTMMLHYYTKIDGKWKLAGVKPCTRSDQFNFDRIFAEPKKDAKL